MRSPRPSHPGRLRRPATRCSRALRRQGGGEREGHSPGEDLVLLISQEQASIQHADTKLGFLLTVVVLMGSRLFQGADTFRHPVASVEGVLGRIGQFAYYGSCALVSASMILLLLGLAPRRTIPGISEDDGVRSSSVNRFAWPSVAGASVAQLTALTSDTVRDEAIRQSLVLARIVRVKFRMFDLSLYTAASGLGLGILWIALP